MHSYMHACMCVCVPMHVRVRVRVRVCALAVRVRSLIQKFTHPHLYEPKRLHTPVTHPQIYLAHRPTHLRS
jgi:hypothetical protein